jgi:hypothetical protein
MVFIPQDLEAGLEGIAINIPAPAPHPPTALPNNMTVGNGAKKPKIFRKARKGASRWRKKLTGKN